MHSAVDDYSRLAYSEVLPNEQAASAVAFWTRAQAFFAAHGITVQWVLTERFNRTLLSEWAYARLFMSGQARADALPAWLHTYNHHRAHTSLGGQPPISRAPVNDLTGHYT